MTTRKLITVITPCYNEQDNVIPCYEAVREVFETQLAAYDYEHIFADNASKDDSAEVLKDLAGRDPRVKVIINSRNFGPFRSTFNALLASRGDAVVVLLAADLQDPPELIPRFVERWEAGNQVVYGIRKTRNEGVVMRTIRKAYYRVVSWLARVDVPPDVGEFQLIDRVIVETLREYDDYYPYIRGMIASCGFEAIGVEYTWQARRNGKSKNRLRDLIDQGLNGIISFTNVPLRLGMILGFVLSGLSIAYAFVSFLLNLIYFRQFAAPGIPTLIVALFFFSGVQLFFLGLLGEYISAIHFQVRKRPKVIEKERINFAPREFPAPRDPVRTKMPAELVNAV